MSFPQIPHGLPSSDVVLGHFSSFIARYPRASSAPRCVHFFGAFLRQRLPEDQVLLVLRRSEFPL